jgi:hypothetical protein
MSAVAARLLPRALPSSGCVRPSRASAPLARRRVRAFATRAAIEAVRFGADKSNPGFIAGPEGAPGVFVIQECVASRLAAHTR